MSKSRSIVEGGLSGIEYLEGYSHGRSRPFLSTCSHIKSLRTRYWEGFYCQYNFWHWGLQQQIYSSVLQCNSIAHGSSPVLDLPDEDESAWLYATARAKLFDEMQKDISVGAIGVFAATLGQTIRSIRNPANILQAFHKMSKNDKLKKSLKLKDVYMHRLAQFNRLSNRKKLQLGLPRQLLQTGISGRLELKYGWEPFLADITDFGAAAMRVSSEQEMAARQCESFRTLTKGKRSSSTGKGSLPPFESGWTLPYLITQREEQRDIEYKVSLRVRPKIPALAHDPYAKMAKATRLVAAAAQIGWELIPYSFVADAFIPVGDFLERLGKEPALEAELSPYGQDNCLVQRKLKRIQTETSFPTISTPKRGGTLPARNSVYKEIREEYSRNIGSEPSAMDTKPSTGLTYNRGINFGCLVSQILLRDFTRSK